MEPLSIFNHAFMISFFVFVMMYAQRLVPFSVLFSTSFVQDVFRAVHAGYNLALKY